MGPFFFRSTKLPIKFLILCLLVSRNYVAGAPEGTRHATNELEKVEIGFSAPTKDSHITANRINIKGKLKHNVPIKQFVGCDDRFQNVGVIRGDEFEVLNIFLVPGTNIISTLAETQTGVVFTNTLTVLAVPDRSGDLRLCRE